MTEYSRSERRRQQELSRRRGGKRKVASPEKATDQRTVNGRPVRIKLPLGRLLLISGLLSLFSVANPLLINFADSIQSQYLYAGQAMLEGQVVYTDFYSSSGLIYYFIGVLGHLFGTSIILMLIQAVAFYFSGAIFYRLVVYFSGYSYLADRLLWVFYLLLAVLGFGGLYPILFALPFLLNGLWFLIRYFSQRVRDEGFIGYGFNAGLVFLIDPRSSLLWLAASLVLLVYNIRNRYQARGFYQALSTFFGFSLIIYTTGYYTVLNKNFGQAVAQTFLYQLEELGFGHGNGFQNFFLILLYLLGTGLITSLVYGFISLFKGRDRDFKVLLCLIFLIHTIEIFAVAQFSPSNLLILVPFGLLLTGAHLADNGIAVPADEREGGVRFKSYFRINGFLPLLAVLYLLLYPAWQFFSSSTVRLERQTAAQYIRAQTGDDDRIYAWDNSALVYLKSQRWSSDEIITPDTYLGNKDNQDNLNLSLGQTKPKFILVNRSQAVLSNVEHLLQTSYEAVDLNLTAFQLYQLK